MINMVNEKFRGTGKNLTMHMDGFSSVISGGVKYFAGRPDVPLKFNQSVIIFRVNDSELSAGKRYPAGSLIAQPAIRRRVEIRANIVELNHPPSALEIGLLATA